MDWHNPSTGKRGLEDQQHPGAPALPGVHNFVIPVNQIGKGRVNVTFGAVNRNALWSVPSTSCSGTIVIP